MTDILWYTNSICTGRKTSVSAISKADRDEDKESQTESATQILYMQLMSAAEDIMQTSCRK